ncbi:MAG: hypothetical protein JXA09_10565 [Anaerolineae bacterium]|nr:hypothetical protein [Anaerolineae bacterium]
MTPTILIATHNPHKVQLFAPVFAQYGIRALALQDVGIMGHRFPETGSTPQENALLKARAYRSAAWPMTFADDAALEIDALGGEPGLQVRRWGGRFPDDVDDRTWLAYLLQRLEGVPLAQRTARYVAAWALIAADGAEHVRHVVHPFTIAERPMRPMRPGSPMSAVELHGGQHLSRRRAQIAAEWAQWGILERIASTQLDGAPS